MFDTVHRNKTTSALLAFCLGTFGTGGDAIMERFKAQEFLKGIFGREDDAPTLSRRDALAGLGLAGLLLATPKLLVSSPAEAKPLDKAADALQPPDGRDPSRARREPRDLLPRPAHHADQHLAFGRKFGELHVHPAAPHEPGEPALMKIYADKDSPRANGEGWHTDVSCDLEPPMGSSSTSSSARRAAATRCSPTCTRPTNRCRTA
jgi:hypothetical protein